MLTIFFSLLLLTATIATCDANQLYIGKSDTQINSCQLSEHEKFAQKYEAIFGEKPSDQIWTRGKNGLKPECCCGNGGGSDGTSF